MPLPVLPAIHEGRREIRLWARSEVECKQKFLARPGEVEKAVWGLKEEAPKGMRELVLFYLCMECVYLPFFFFFTSKEVAKGKQKGIEKSPT